MLNNYDEIPFEALIYLTGECYYGGKVIDDWDRRTINAILRDFYNESLINDGKYRFTVLKNYFVPKDSAKVRPILEYIQSLPN